MTISADRSEAIIAHRARERKRWRYVLLFLLMTAVSLVFDIATGPSMLSPSEVIRSLTGIGERAAMTDAIVREFRLPMALMALVVGAALGARGHHSRTDRPNLWRRSGGVAGPSGQSGDSAGERRVREGFTAAAESASLRCQSLNCPTVAGQGHPADSF